MTIAPHSENIVFYDAEFTDLDPKKGELLSIGLIKPSGEELYIEFEHSGECHPWVVKNVLPFLEGITIERKAAIAMIKDFIGDSEPFLLSYVNQLDAVYWYELFGSPKDHPAFWIPIDFASILFGYGFAPNGLGNKKFLKMIGMNVDYDNREHNALDDARILKDVYNKFYTYISKT